MQAPRTRFVLIETSHAGNVGAVARAMKVMGFDDLVLVNPRWPDVLTRPEAIERASGATDGLARHYAERAIEAGFDAPVDPALKIFFYMPYEHSEALDDQQRSLDLFRATGDENYIKYAQLHYDLIARFGRFPHRNEAMGRVSTQEERDYLASGGFSG